MVVVEMSYTMYREREGKFSGRGDCPGNGKVRIPLTIYGHIKTVQQRTIIQQYGDWYTGR